MLSVTTEHAFRALVCLARKPMNETVLGRELATEAEVPMKYLSKILNDLKRAGILDATRGMGGGYRLHKRADEIRLIEVVEVFEGKQARLGCLLGKEKCSDDAACPAHDYWKHVKQMYLNFMEKTTIADIAGNENPVPVSIPAMELK